LPNQISLSLQFVTSVGTWDLTQESQYQHFSSTLYQRAMTNKEKTPMPAKEKGTKAGKALLLGQLTKQ
jgi:hypothetical protein